MYEEIIQSLMLQKIVGMVLLFALAIIGFAVFYVLFEHLNKKKKQKKILSKKQKITAKNEEKDNNKTFFAALLVALLLCFFGCWNLYEYLSLREDMMSENYATYTGEFRYNESYHKSGGITKSISWEDENGKTHSITYDSAIDDYQPNNIPLKEGNYRGTIVYSPRGGYLLWWDAEPIGD